MIHQFATSGNLINGHHLYFQHKVKRESWIDTLSKDASITEETVMKAILRTSSPITTHAIVRQSWKFLRQSTAMNFEMAGLALEKLGLGRVTRISGKSGGQAVFIKRKPADVTENMAANSHLCTLEMYTMRYNQSPSKSLSLVLRAKLIELKLVAESQLK